jgi:hypothetical protein
MRLVEPAVTAALAALAVPLAVLAQMAILQTIIAAALARGNSMEVAEVSVEMQRLGIPILGAEAAITTVTVPAVAVLEILDRVNAETVPPVLREGLEAVVMVARLARFIRLFPAGIVMEGRAAVQVRPTREGVAAVAAGRVPARAVFHLAAVVAVGAGPA